jgi:copper chaperone NosL
MMIDDPAYAAAYRTAGGQARLFDDVTHMVLYGREHHETATVSFVHDYKTRAWLQAENASYVDSPRLRSPMGNGVVAMATEASARALAEQTGGRVLAFPDVLEQASSRMAAGH